MWGGRSLRLTSSCKDRSSGPRPDPRRYVSFPRVSPRPVPGGGLLERGVECGTRPSRTHPESPSHPRPPDGTTRGKEDGRSLEAFHTPGYPLIDSYISKNVN